MGLPECGIPEGDLPQCWSDDVRMNALFAPFRIKTANPESWDMKMKFWSDMLRQWCKCRKDPVLSAADARAAFMRRGRTPACIEIVVEEMFRNGDLSPISKYQQILHNGPEGWVKWGARIAFKPAAFAFTAVASLLPTRQVTDNDGLPKASIECTQRFVLESAVREQATELLNEYPLDAERIGTIEELMRSCGWTRSRDIFELLLGYLVSQGAAVKKGDVVKLAEPNKKVLPVTETDEALAKLAAAEARLQADAARAKRDAAAAEQDARAALQLGNKLAAKNHLRRKHKSAARLQRCTAALDNVCTLLQQLREVSDNAAIVDTYKSSSEAMKREMKEGALTEDAVHDTMDDLKEVMDTYNEVEKILGGTTEDCDLAELEEELNELLARPGPPSGGTAARDKRDGVKLPSPPASRPSRKLSERDFVFDGEERMLAELDHLDDDSVARERPRTPRRKVALADQQPPASERPPQARAEKAWYPRSEQCLRPGVWADAANNNRPFELRQDDRIHPGQQLNVDFRAPARHYAAEFAVRDHKLSGGVWLYSARDGNRNLDAELAGTEYFSSESPGKTNAGFMMAPGGERRKSALPEELGGSKPADAPPCPAWPGDEPAPHAIDDLERRLKNLRGLDL